MNSYVEAESTLPSVSACFASYSKKALVLTVVYHPCADLIGYHYVIQPPSKAADFTLSLGRLTPRFISYHGAVDKRVLEDQHISRKALQLITTRSGVTLERPAHSSLCVVDSKTLSHKVEIEQARLLVGVVICLANSVVLLLRENEINTDKPALQQKTALLGCSYYWKNLSAQISNVAAVESDVLIQGPTGSGKEVAAQSIHQLSARHNHSLVAVNMAAVPPTLAASELFGCVKGAFTGATADKKGYFEQAGGGTLFLDEVGDTPLEVQAQLLRAIQQREVQRVGGAAFSVNLRIVSATSAATGDGVDEGPGFKSALRHRLGACEINLLPLADHPEDIGLLAWCFFAQFAQECERLDLITHPKSNAKAVARMAQLFSRFCLYRWPGNIRELQNKVRQVVVESGNTLKVPNLKNPAQPKLSDSKKESKAERSLKKFSLEEFTLIFTSNDFEVAPTAKDLGVSRQAVYRYIELSATYFLADDIAEDKVQQAILDASGSLSLAAKRLQVSASSLAKRLRRSGNIEHWDH